METKKDYLNRIYNLARVKGLCRTQREFANLIALNPGTLSKALQGDEKYCTDRVIVRVRTWAGQMGLEGEEPIKPVEPDIVIPAATATLYNNMSETIRLQAEIIARLQGGLSAPGAGLYPQKNFRTDVI